MCLNHVISSRYFIVLFAVEAAVIIIGNVFTIFVFKTQSALHLKRTSFLLINLAVADLSTRRSRRSCSPSDSQNSQNCYQVFDCLMVRSSLWYVHVGNVSRCFIAGTRLRRVLATASSRNKVNKRSSLHYQHRYRLGNWVIHHRTLFVNSISRKCGYHLCRGYC